WFIGYKTFFFTCANWILHNSLQSRNILILHAGDVYLRLCLFWSLFLPLGARYSVDQFLIWYQNRKQQSSKIHHHDNVSGSISSSSSSYNSNSIITGGTLALTVQIVTMYVTSVYHKSGAEWSVHGTATF